MEPSTPDKKPVRVTILSRPYVLRTAGDPREVEAVAASVNDLMLAIASKAPNADSTQIAVLACLQLADQLRDAERELSVARQRGEKQSDRVTGLVLELIEAVEAAR
jgi:cell division protein ZapA (FtsZ GTPase activity inhibitor)